MLPMSRPGRRGRPCVHRGACWAGIGQLWWFLRPRGIAWVCLASYGLRYTTFFGGDGRYSVDFSTRSSRVRCRPSLGGCSFPGRAECTSKQAGARPLLFRARTRAFLCHQLGECACDSFELGCTHQRDYQLSASSSTCSRCGMSSGFAMWPFMPAFSAFWRSSSKAFAVMAKMGVFALRVSAMARIRLVAS